VQNYLCTFSAAQVSEASAVKALFGEIEIHGHLPVTIPGVAARGEGIVRRRLRSKARKYGGFRNANSIFQFLPARDGSVTALGCSRQCEKRQQWQDKNWILPLPLVAFTLTRMPTPAILDCRFTPGARVKPKNGDHDEERQRGTFRGRLRVKSGCG